MQPISLSRSVVQSTISLLVVAILSLSGCGGGGGGGATASPAPALTGTLTSIAVTPASPTVATGVTTKLTATGTYSSGATADISGSVTWTSANPATATVGSTGILKALAAGSTDITASAAGVTSPPDTINVTQAVASLNTWTTQTPLLYARDNDANAVLNGKVYVFGGSPTGTGVLSSMEVYDPATDTWPGADPTTLTVWPAMPEARYGLAAVPANGGIYLMGGTKAITGGGPIYPIAFYDPKTNTFSSNAPGTSTPLANLPTGRWGFHAVTVDGIVYTVGGSLFVPGGMTPTNWQYKVTGATSGAAIPSAASGVLANGTPYYFVVTAVDAGGKEGPASIEVSATPEASYAAGVTPSALSTAAGNGQATINWVGVSGASSYNVYYGTRSGDATSNLTKVSGITATTATVTGLANGTAYYFVVTAVVGGSETAPSTEVGVTPQPLPPSSAPSNVTVAGGNGQLTLSWSPVANAASYNVYYGKGTALYYGTVEAYNPATNTWTTKAPMPTPRQGHAVAVVNGRIYAIGGWGGWPDLSTVEVYDPATNTWATTVPVTPATIAANTAGKPLAPMPTARDDFGFSVVNGIIYAIGGDTNAFDAVLGIPCCTTVVEAYDPVANIWTTDAPMPTMRDDFDASMVDGVIYAIAGSRDGKFDNPALPNNGGQSFTTNEAYRMSSIPVPNGVVAATGTNQVTLTWNAVAGATSYNIYWSNKAGVATTANSTLIPIGASTSFTHTGLTAGTWYYYVVTAVTASGESLPSNEVAVRP